MSLTQKIAIAAGALTLGVAGVAAASTTPDVADTGLTKASEQVVVDQSVAADDATGADEKTDDVDTDSTDNHGADVSAVAQSEFDSGREHGEAVSEVAKDNHGAEVSDDVEADEADADLDDDEVEVEHEDDDADDVEHENEHEGARP